MTTRESPILVVLAGPNGAGKSTFFEQFLRATGIFFVNADILARAISPEDPMSVSERAAEVADVERRALLKRHESFCMETVFSDPVGEKVEFLREARAAGYRVVLIFIGLESTELSIARVSQRVADGGHDVPDEKLHARFPRVLVNLERARYLVDELLLFDNSDAERPFRAIARLERGVVKEQHYGVPEWAVNVLRR